MTTFIYEAYNREGVINRGEYESEDRNLVIDYLAKHDLTPISVKRLHSETFGRNILSLELFSTLEPVDIVFLVRNLATTTKAGLSIVDSLDILIQDTDKKIMKKVLEEAKSMIKNGRHLSDAFEAYADSFPPIFIGMLRAGELSGQLDKTLAELAKYLYKEYELRNKVKSALTYPVILLVSSIGVVAMLLMFVLPRLTKAFEASGVQLPLLTRIFIVISDILTWSFMVDGLVVAFMVYFFFYFRKTNTGRRFFFSVMSHTPVASALIKKIAIVRFSRVFGNLIGSGLGAVESLELSAASVGNESYSLAITSVVSDVKNGIDLSQAFGKFPDLFPKMLISLISVGERTGSLQSILVTFSDFYEEEVDTNLKQLTAFLEPVLLLIMGLMVGAIAFAIIVPIYQLVGHFV